MTPAARVAAAADVLDTILAGAAAEQSLTSWARRSRFAGSKDRAAIRDHVFDALRCKLSFAALGGAMSGRGLMLGQIRAEGGDPALVFSGEGYGAAALTPEEQTAGYAPETDAERLNLPDWLLPQFRASLGDQAEAAAKSLTERAPVMVRVNMRVGSVEDAVSSLADDGITAIPHKLAGTALVATDGSRRIRLSSAFESGLVELQDGASQAVVEALPLSEGQVVLDYCAGGGGKTLAIAAQADVLLYAHDKNVVRMRDLPMRALRANAQVRMLQTNELQRHGPYDLVLCDVPCSGSGAWRRSPDAKWDFTEEKLRDLNVVQDEVLADSAELTAPSGILAYATCSVLDIENRDRISSFLRHNSGWKCIYEHSFTLADGGDGFYTAHLTRVK
ncbi:MAG: RsmB/NOP family class I SAM-dependent RNA methyltransferase [Paracoccaceae bacterium]